MDATTFYFRWQRIAPDQDDFLGTFGEDEDLSARIYQAPETGARAWRWMVAVDGRQIGAGFAGDPRAAAHAAEQVYFAKYPRDDGTKGKLASA
jgi:hypothetical protein